MGGADTALAPTSTPDDQETISASMFHFPYDILYFPFVIAGPTQFRQ